MYQAGNVGLTFLAAILACRERRTRRSVLRIALWIAGAALVVLLQGTNDVTMLLTTFLLGAGALYAFRARRDSVGFWTGLLAVAVERAPYPGSPPATSREPGQATATAPSRSGSV